MLLPIPPIDDFDVTANLSNPRWNVADWHPLTRVKGDGVYTTRFKTAYSPAGMYFLFDVEDKKLTCSMTRDFDDIYNEDVIEVFLWPDERHPLYFEYEISPLGVELPIVVPNNQGTFMGWLPWHYEGDRLIRRATAVRGGPKAAGAAVQGWIAEFFIPFKLLTGMGNTPPKAGTRWRANMFRIDYDNGATHWAWDPATGGSFHNYTQFGTIEFK